MPISASERRFIDEVSLALPWGLVEQFSTTPRWRPEDVNRGADMLIAKLRGVGVPVEVHEPEICLSVPLSASVTAGGVTYRAKPPSSSLCVPDGCSGRLVALQANPRALRSYNRDIATLFGGSIRSVAEVKRLVGGNIVVMLGFGNPALASLIEEWGGAGLIAVNPGVDIHWGTCTTIWGSPDLQELRAQAAHPGSRGEQSGRPETAGAGCLRRRGDDPHRPARGLVHAEGAGGDRSRRRRSGQVRAGAWPL